MVAPALIGAGIGGGVGLIQYMQARDQEKKDREVEAAKAAYAPWTGMMPGRVKRASFWDTVGGGALTGGMIGGMVPGSQDVADTSLADGAALGEFPQGDDVQYGPQQSMRMQPDSAYDQFAQGPADLGPQQSMRMDSAYDQYLQEGGRNYPQGVPPAPAQAAAPQPWFDQGQSAQSPWFDQGQNSQSPWFQQNQQQRQPFFPRGGR